MAYVFLICFTTRLRAIIWFVRTTSLSRHIKPFHILAVSFQRRWWTIICYFFDISNIDTIYWIRIQVIEQFGRKVMLKVQYLTLFRKLRNLIEFNSLIFPFILLVKIRMTVFFPEKGYIMCFSLFRSLWYLFKCFFFRAWLTILRNFIILILLIVKHNFSFVILHIIAVKALDWNIWIIAIINCLILGFDSKILKFGRCVYLQWHLWCICMNVLACSSTVKWKSLVETNIFAVSQMMNMILIFFSIHLWFSLLF